MPDYHKLPIRNNTRKALALGHWLASLVPDLDSLLDVGAGDGKLAEAFPSEFSYRGLDIGADIYSRTQRVRYIEDFPALRRAISEGAPPDAVSIFDVLEHTDDFVSLFRDATAVARRFVFVSLPNEMNLECRIRFLFGQPIAAHGLNMLPGKPGHKHQWLITFEESQAVLAKEADRAGFRLTHVVFTRKISSKPISAAVYSPLFQVLPPELVAHGFAFLFKRVSP